MKTDFGELTSVGGENPAEVEQAKAAALKQKAAEDKLKKQQESKQKGQLIGSLLGAIVGGIAGEGNPMAIQAGASAGGAIGGGVGGASQGDISGTPGILTGLMSMPGGGKLLGMEGAGTGSSIMQAGAQSSKMADLDKMYKSGLIDQDKYAALKQYLSIGK